MTVHVSWPMRLKNTLNTREHWAVKAKRVKAERKATYMMLFAGRTIDSLGVAPVPEGIGGRLAVRLVRIYAGKCQPMDDDGLTAAFKHVRDEVAAYFGVDDADPRIRFECAQVRGSANAVRIDFAVERDVRTVAELNGAAARARIDEHVRTLLDDEAAELSGTIQ
jgi:hypothetical protein